VAVVGIPRWHASGRKIEVEVSQESRERLSGALIEIDVRAGVSGRLTAEGQVNALVKQVNALLTVGYFALPVSVHRWDERLPAGREVCRSPAHAGVVGAREENLRPLSCQQTPGTAVLGAVLPGRLRP
jgi:hypothetical protein